MPAMPSFVTTAAGQRFWEEFGPACNALGLLESLDVIAYGVLCESFATLEDMRTAFDQAPWFTQAVGTNGAEQPNPLLTEIRNQVKGILNLLAEFGMTPAARQKLTGSTSATPADPHSDPMAVLFDQANDSGDIPSQPDAPTPTKPTKRKRRRKAASKRPAKKKTATAKTN